MCEISYLCLYNFKIRTTEPNFTSFIVFIKGKSTLLLKGANFPLPTYCTSYQKLACFVLYLKIINTFLKNNICILYNKLLKVLKNGIGILVGQAVFNLKIKTVKMLLDQ